MCSSWLGRPSSGRMLPFYTAAMLAADARGLEIDPIVTGSPDEIRAQRKRHTALGYRILASYGWGDDGAGHITARDPERTDHFWVLRTGIAFGDATVHDLVLVEPGGEAVDGHASLHYNTAAHHIHHPIHMARPDIVSACHTHTGYGTPLAARCEPLRMISQEACAFHDSNSVYEGDDLDVRDTAGGTRIAAALGGNKLVFLANHGMLTAGETVASAVGFFYLAERAAEVQVKSPTGRVVSDHAARLTAARVGSEDAGRLVFQNLVLSRVGDTGVVD